MELQEILTLVEKPSRYLGNELNSVHKDPESVDVRMVLAFPDLYDVGLGNLGIHILYAAVNALPWAWCERSAAPAVDMERELRKRDMELFVFEFKESFKFFDFVGFTLQSELTYTNILNMLDLSGIPLRTSARGEEHPIVCAGGPAVFNPEPIAPFVDVFVIGDGEDAIIDIAKVLQKLKGATRRAKLFALSHLEGVYVPELYPFDTLEDGRIVPALNAPRIRKRITRKLDGAVFPTNYLVPFTKQVHDRISLEVLRGCTQGCRFCQAGMTTRPVRERSLENVDALLEETLKNTGYEEVSLVSLSTCDHSRVRQLVENTVEKAKPKRVSVSLPSLRLDSFSVELADMVAETRRTGLTVAPEAASPRLRAVINKWIPDEGLLDMAQGAFERGWRHVKLYFMIGLPTERDDDVAAIADLAIRTLNVGKDIQRGAKINLGVSTFVPKPFTPFQWAEQLRPEETQRRQAMLGRLLSGYPAIKYGRHDPEETFLEGLVSRSDRRAADLLEAAFRKGCRFDAWREHLRFDWWLEAIEETGFDVDDALRARDLEERLPWDHIDIFVPKEWFVEDWKRAVALEHAEDCRHRKCHKCGVIDEERDLCAHMLRNQVKGRPAEANWTRKEIVPFVEPDPVMRLWFRIQRTGDVRHLSHLETMGAWIRALRRADTPLSYSQGFHPQPRVAFTAALPSGEETRGDYMDITMHEEVAPEELVERLRRKLPDGFDVTGVHHVARKAPSLMGLATGARYVVRFVDHDPDEVMARLEELRDAEEILVERKGKKRNKPLKGGRKRRRARIVNTLNIRPMIRSIEGHVHDGVLTVDVTFGSVDGKPGKPRELVALMSTTPQKVRIVKTEVLTDRSGEWMSLDEWWDQYGRPKPVAAPALETVPEPA
jgi:radical SAM family uncharacterized protein/radical SAM-linked protein